LDSDIHFVLQRDEAQQPLDSEVVGEALDLALRDLEQPATAVSPRTDTLKNELARLDVELSRYAEAIADAGPLATILQAVKAREQRRDAIRSELKTLATPRRAGTRATSEIRAELVEYLDNWRDMARQSVAEARRLLRAVLVGRFVFTPVTPPPELPPRKGPGRKPRFIYELKGEATLSGLIAGLISASSVVAPTGFEPVFGHGRVFATRFSHFRATDFEPRRQDSNTYVRERHPQTGGTPCGSRRQALPVDLSALPLPPHVLSKSRLEVACRPPRTPLSSGLVGRAYE